MEGVLYKWTNYYNGWQPRHFILDEENSVLSYYASKEEIEFGCKGSYKIVSSCKLDVGRADPTQLELRFPPSHTQALYLRAPTAQERQKWISKIIELKNLDANSLGLGDGDKRVNTQEFLNSRKNQIVFYRDHLRKILDELKECREPEESEKLWQQIGPVSDSLITTIDECIGGFGDQGNTKPRLINRTFSLDPEINSRGKQTNPDYQRTLSDVQHDLPSLKIHTTESIHIMPSALKVAGAKDQQSELNAAEMAKYHDYPDSEASSQLDVTEKEVNNSIEANELPEMPPKITIFERYDINFGHALVSGQKDVKTVEFLEASKPILDIIDIMGSSGMGLVKKDLAGNIKKITEVYNDDKKHSATLLGMVDYEMKTAKKASKIQKGTESLLWLKRGLQFLQIFLTLVLKGEKADSTESNGSRGENSNNENLNNAATSAYNAALRRHHNFVAVGAFKVAMRSLPQRTTFFNALAHEAKLTASPEYRLRCGDELGKHAKDMGICLDIIHQHLEDKKWEDAMPAVKF